MNPLVVDTLPQVSAVSANTKFMVVDPSQPDGVGTASGSRVHSYASQSATSSPPVVRDYISNNGSNLVTSWVKPANLAFIEVECVGGGGSGASVPRVDAPPNAVYCHLGSAGASGHYAKKVISASSLPTSVAITAGGDSVAPDTGTIGYSSAAELRVSGVSTDGLTSSFGSLCRARGGKGGVALFYIPTNYISHCGANTPILSGSIGDTIHHGDLIRNVTFDNRHIFHRLFTAQPLAPKASATGDGQSHYPATTASNYVTQAGNNPGDSTPSRVYGAGGGGAYRIWFTTNDNDATTLSLGGKGYRGIVRITEYYQTEVA